jgi:hypothetical protein
MQTSRTAVLTGGDGAPVVFWADGLLLRRKPEPNPDPLPQRLDRNLSIGHSPRHLFDTGIQFGRADSLALQDFPYSSLQ